MPRFVVLFSLIVISSTALSIAAAQQAPIPIRFARGGDSAQVKGSIVRGEVQRYSLTARAGQRLRLWIRSAENNAVLQLYPPRSRQALPGTGEGQDARSWSGALPTTGSYLIVVGSTRGNASYTLDLTIR